MRDEIRYWVRSSEEPELRIVGDAKTARTMVRNEQAYMRSQGIRLRFRILQDGESVVLRRIDRPDVIRCDLQWPIGEERTFPDLPMAEIRSQARRANALARAKRLRLLFVVLGKGHAVRKVEKKPNATRWHAEIQQAARLKPFERYDLPNMTVNQAKHIAKAAMVFRSFLSCKLMTRCVNGETYIQAMPMDQFEKVHCLPNGGSVRLRISNKQRSNVMRKACYHGLLIESEYLTESDCYEFRRIG